MRTCILSLLLVLGISFVVRADVIPMVDNFNDAASCIFTPYTDEYTHNTTLGVFNGQGQLVQSVADYSQFMYRNGQAGDQTVYMDMGVEDQWNSNYVLWTYQLNDSAAGQQKFQIWLQKASLTSLDLWCYCGGYNSQGVWSTNKWQNLGQLTKWAFTYDWIQSTGTLNVSISANGGPMTPFWSGSGLYNSDPIEYMYPGGAGVASLDYYSVTPEPATMLLLGLGGLVLRRKVA